MKPKTDSYVKAERLKDMPAIEAGHLQTAAEMANALIKEFEPHEQNEAVAHIFAIIKKDRRVLIEEAEERAASLKETYDQLEEYYKK